MQYMKRKKKNRFYENSFHALAFYRRRVKVVKFNFSGARFRPVREWKCDLNDPALQLVEKCIV